MIKTMMPFVDKRFYNSTQNMEERIDKIRNLLQATNLLVEPEDEVTWLEQTSKFTRVREQEGSFAEIYMGNFILQKKSIPCVLKKLNTRKYIESEITNYVFMQKLCPHGVCNIINVYLPENIDEPIQILMYNCGKTVKTIKEELDLKNIRREWMIDICRWGLDLCKILECVHSNNMAYLDLRPENIVIHYKKAKLIDFGLSRFGNEPEKHVAGSACYLPPEMTLYSECHFGKSDIFSLGVLLYHLLLPYKIDPATSKPLNPPIISSALMRETIDYALSKINKYWQSLSEDTDELHNAYNNISYFDILLYKNWITDKTYTMLTTGTHRRIFLLIRSMTLINSLLRPSIPMIKIELEEIGYTLGAGFTKEYKIGWE
jgi:serine/threonine protein kinase